MSLNSAYCLSIISSKTYIASNTQVRSHQFKNLNIINIRQEITILLLSYPLANKHISIMLTFNYRIFLRKHYQEISFHFIFIIHHMLNGEFIGLEFKSRLQSLTWNKFYVIWMLKEESLSFYKGKWMKNVLVKHKHKKIFIF